MLREANKISESLKRHLVRFNRVVLCQAITSHDVFVASHLKRRIYRN